ncbi:hypothetical protein N3S92_004256 [Cronobacter sakazakii]|nr:hypothetical protein [Cronobacter sakazakii]KAB0886871.1 hypothetical protein FZI56_21495 [Cronobacter sakazakii]
MKFRYVVTGAATIDRVIMSKGMSDSDVDAAIKIISMNYVDKAKEVMREHGRGKHEVFLPAIKEIRSEEPGEYLNLRDACFKNCEYSGGKPFALSDFSIPVFEQLMSIILCDELFPIHDYLTSGEPA